MAVAVITVLSILLCISTVGWIVTFVSFREACTALRFHSTHVCITAHKRKVTTVTDSGDGT